MSFDVSLIVVKPTEVFSSNYTYNCSQMFRTAIGQDGIRTLHGLKASDVISQLERAVAHISDPDNVDIYAPMEPSNGWGSHKGAIEYLRGILAACREYPDGIFDV